MRAVFLAVAAFVLVACTPSIPAPVVPVSSPAATASPTPSTLAQKAQAAGIADCPVVPAAPAPQGGLPDVVVSCLGSGQGVRLSALRGPLILNLWAQWCAPCRAEAPHLRDVAAVSAGKLTVMGMDTADPDPALAIEFAQAAGWQYPQLADADKAGVRGLGITSLPMTLFVDASGAVVYRHVGAFGSTAQAKELVATYLGVTL